MTQLLLLKIGSIVLMLGGLIFVHELGHFLVAKALQVKVVRFSIGFGPRLFGFRRGETDYWISALPLGGYVKMAGDDPREAPRPEDRGRGFLEQSPGRRFLIAAAGPLANLLFPVLLYVSLGLWQNGKPVPGPTVGTVSPASPAAAAGLRPGDRILDVSSPRGGAHAIRWFSDLRDAVSPYPGRPLTFTVERDGKPLPPMVITPERIEEPGPLEPVVRGVIGVTPMYASALVMPASPGAAGGVEPFDLVVKAGDRRVRHLGDLDRALAAASCGPIDLEVVREPPGAPPGSARPSAKPLLLPGVPSCVNGSPSLLPADPGVSTAIAQVTPGGPAAEAGLRRGDAIAEVNGKAVHSFQDLNLLSDQFHAGQKVLLRLTDGRAVTLVPGEREVRDETTGGKVKRLWLGFYPARAPVDPESLYAQLVPIRLGLAEITVRSWEQVWDVTRVIVLGIGKIFTGQISFKTVGGPLTLFSIAAQAVEEGWASFLLRMAVLSINLGLMNLVPIPVLDGGHIVACAVEGATRRRLSLRAREVANLVGLVLLALLMLAAFKNDIARLMG